MCQDCQSRVHHHSHIVQGSVIEQDCVLCNFLHFSYYLIPQVLTLSAGLSVAFFLVQQTQHVVCRTLILPNLRAPPLMV